MMGRKMRGWKLSTAVGLTAAVVSLGSVLSTAAMAEYPERPITVVIPYGPGGATDISGRTLAVPLGKLIPHPVLA